MMSDGGYLCLLLDHGCVVRDSISMAGGPISGAIRSARAHAMSFELSGFELWTADGLIYREMAGHARVLPRLRGV
jgi:hypothetical protein